MEISTAVGTFLSAFGLPTGFFGLEIGKSAEGSAVFLGRPLGRFAGGA